MPWASLGAALGLAGLVLLMWDDDGVAFESHYGLFHFSVIGEGIDDQRGFLSREAGPKWA
ncbi:MAG: hypothetical protein ABIK44_03720 [candidate division WOR-3 bacterium]